MAAHGQPTVAAILVAAGSGERLGTDRPKALVEVAGRTLLEHAVRRLIEHTEVRDVIVVAPPDCLAVAADLASAATVVAGGSTRQQSVARGLAAVGDDVDVVLVHDVARAFVPADLIARVIAAIGTDVDGAIPLLPMTDSIRRTSSGPGGLGPIVDRSTLAAVQTPQGFRRAILVRAHAQATGLDATDDATLVEAVGGRLVAVPGAADAFKITYPVDLLLAEAMANR